MRQIALGGIVVLLLAGPGGVEAQESSLIEAVRQQDGAAIDSLLKRGAKVSVTSPDGTTALHWASYHDDLVAAEALVRRGADVNATNQLGIAPLHLACENGSAVMVELLLKAGADPRREHDGDRISGLAANAAAAPNRGDSA